MKRAIVQIPAHLRYSFRPMFENIFLKIYMVSWVIMMMMMRNFDDPQNRDKNGMISF